MDVRGGGTVAKFCARSFGDSRAQPLINRLKPIVLGLDFQTSKPNGEGGRVMIHVKSSRFLTVKLFGDPFPSVV